MSRVDLGRAEDWAGHADHDAQACEAGDHMLLTLIAELRAARQFREDIAAALAPGRWRGFDGPDGVDVLEVIEDVRQALRRHDQAVGP